MSVVSSSNVFIQQDNFQHSFKTENDECCEEFEQMYYFHSNKYKDVSCEDIVKKNDYFIEHVDSSFEATKINLQPSYFYDLPIVLNFVKEFFIQENDQ